MRFFTNIIFLLDTRVAAIHQPNFYPWLGYFYKLSQSDVFVILDHVPFSKGSFTPRVKIHTDNASEIGQWITVPIKKHPIGTPISEIIIDRSKVFEEVILGKLRATYRDAPYFTQMMTFVEKHFSSLGTVLSLSDFNSNILLGLLDFLAIELEIFRSSEMPFAYNHYASLVDICHEIKATKYWSGKGGMKYQVDQMFLGQPVEVGYIDIQSHWEDNDFPEEFKYKSILAYMAYYSQEELQAFFQKI